jgi:hypothetical protein
MRKTDHTAIRFLRLTGGRWACLKNVTENKCQLTLLGKKEQNHAGLDEFWFG